MFKSASALLQATIAANVLMYLYGSVANKSLFSVDQNTSIRAMLLSMFTHGSDWHLFSNMMELFFAGESVFVTTKSKHWKNPWAFLFVYIVSGIGGFLGVCLVARILDAQWDRHLQYMQCEEFNTPALGSAVEDQLTDIVKRFALWHFKLAHRVGASGAVFGVVGARFYTAFFSKEHAKLTEHDTKIWVFGFGVALADSPWTLDKLLSFHLVDHAGLFFGCITGFICAIIWHQWGARWTLAWESNEDLEMEEFLNKLGVTLVEQSDEKDIDGSLVITTSADNMLEYDCSQTSETCE